MRLAPANLTGCNQLLIMFDPALKELKLPILVISGRFDRMVPPSLLMPFREHVPHAELVIFEKRSFPICRRPEATFAPLRKFLE